MPFDKTRFKSLQVNNALYDDLTTIAKWTAEKEGVSNVSRPVMLEKLIKVYKQHYNI